MKLGLRSDDCLLLLDGDVDFMADFVLAAAAAVAGGGVVVPSDLDVFEDWTWAFGVVVVVVVWVWECVCASSSGSSGRNPESSTGVLYRSSVRS